jgi:FKBP12-rapamycin complex-associated protein
VRRNSILNKMRKHYNSLVDAALLVSKELIRVAILWHEMWHEGLNEASRLYFSSRDVEGMFKKLQPLHEMLEKVLTRCVQRHQHNDLTACGHDVVKGPETLREVSFQQAYGRDLKEALEWCKKYSRSNKVSDLNQAWDLYYHVFRRLDKQLPQMTTFELQYATHSTHDTQQQHQ